jgi:hypothetical protein
MMTKSHSERFGATKSRLRTQNWNYNNLKTNAKPKNRYHLCCFFFVIAGC